MYHQMVKEDLISLIKIIFVDRIVKEGILFWIISETKFIDEVKEAIELKFRTSKVSLSRRYKGR